MTALFLKEPFAAALGKKNNKGCVRALTPALSAYCSRPNKNSGHSLMYTKSSTEKEVKANFNRIIIYLKPKSRYPSLSEAVVSPRRRGKALTAEVPFEQKQAPPKSKWGPDMLGSTKRQELSFLAQVARRSFESGLRWIEALLWSLLPVYLAALDSSAKAHQIKRTGRAFQAILALVCHGQAAVQTLQAAQGPASNRRQRASYIDSNKQADYTLSIVSRK